MSWGGNILAGGWFNVRSGGFFSQGIYFIMPLLCRGGNNSSTHEGTLTCNRSTMAKETAPEHLSVRTLLGSTDKEILDVAEQVYRRKYEVVPSILPCRHQDQFMAQLHKELGQHLVRARIHGMTGTARSLSRERRHSQAHSSSQARSPSAKSRRKDLAKQLRGDSLVRSSQPCSRHSKSRAWQHQSQLPGHQQPSGAPPWASTRRPHRSTLPCPSPLCPHHEDEQLHCFLSKLHLQPQWQESRRRGLARCSQTALWYMPQDTPIPCKDQPQSVNLRVPHGNRSWSTLQMTWDTHCHYPLTWPAS